MDFATNTLITNNDLNDFIPRMSWTGRHQIIGIKIILYQMVRKHKEKHLQKKNPTTILISELVPYCFLIGLAIDICLKKLLEPWFLLLPYYRSTSFSTILLSPHPNGETRVVRSRTPHHTAGRTMYPVHCNCTLPSSKNNSLERVKRIWSFFISSLPLPPPCALPRDIKEIACRIQVNRNRP